PDPLLTGNNNIAQSILTVSSTTLPDNDWKLFNVAQVATALNPQSGDYFYHLVAIWTTLNNPNEENLFKVSIQGTPFLLAGSTIGFIGAAHPELGGIPNNIVYDGNFTFQFVVPSGTASISLWDGDADRVDDTDDPNSPSLPPFQTSPFTKPQGVNPGNPADDGGTVLT